MADFPNMPRPALPYVSPAGHTVAVCGGEIYINARRYSGVEALDLSAVIARAVHETAQQTPQPPQ